MNAEDIKQRLEDANRTGGEAVFTQDEVIPAEWIRELTLSDGHPKGLRVKGATIQGRLDFDDCILARPLLLASCTIAGGISLRRAKAKMLGFQNCPEIGGIEGDSLEVQGHFLLRRSKFTQQVFLLGGRVGRNLECDGAKMDGGKVASLQADGLEVGGALFMRGGFVAKGKVALNRVKAGALIDDSGSWPEKGQLVLTGFTYDDIGRKSPQTAAERLDWLSRREDDGRFDPKPYEQLAKVLKVIGHDRDAREVLIAKEKERLAKGKLPWFVWPWWWLYGLVSGFGYRRFRPLLWALAIIAVGAVVFDWAKSEGLMVPIKDRVYLSLGESKIPVKDVPKHYTRLNPAIYSADLFLPFVDLAQDGYWMPSSTGRVGRLLTAYMWLHITLGWFLSAIGVAAVTGLIKRE